QRTQSGFSPEPAESTVPLTKIVIFRHPALHIQFCFCPRIYMPPKLKQPRSVSNGISCPRCSALEPLFKSELLALKAQLDETMSTLRSEIASVHANLHERDAVRLKDSVGLKETTATLPGTAHSVGETEERSLTRTRLKTTICWKGIVGGLHPGSGVAQDLLYEWENRPVSDLLCTFTQAFLREQGITTSSNGQYEIPKLLKMHYIAYLEDKCKSYNDPLNPEFTDRINSAFDPVDGTPTPKFKLNVNVRKRTRCDSQFY
ncbi:hypothetical protein BJ741DRAFT_174087, partial [Chytriomyces cf. hyalinus JEL632]